MTNATVNGYQFSSVKHTIIDSGTSLLIMPMKDLEELCNYLGDNYLSLTP